MKIGRVILTHRQDVVLALKNFYFGAYSDFLVIGCNQLTVELSKFQQTDNFKMFGYIRSDFQEGLNGRQFIAWVEAAKRFPKIDAWVIHDYDVLAKVCDKEVFKHVSLGHYGCVGLPFPNWQPGLPSPVARDVFPFSRHYVSKDDKPSPDFCCREKYLIQKFPTSLDGISTVMSGYGDFLAIYRDDLLKLDDHQFSRLPGGLEQVPHTVLRYYNVQPVDFRAFFSLNISMDNVFYVPFKNTYDISHPVKFWPGINRPPFKVWCRRLIKLFLGQGYYARSRA